MNSLQKAANTALKVYMGLKKGEKVLIIYDNNKKKIANSIFKEAKKLTNNTKLLKIPAPKISGEEPIKNVAKEMLKYDVIFLVTSKSLTHTKARRNACKKGARIASMPNITESMFRRTITPNYKRMEKITKKLGTILTQGKRVKIITKAGTNLTMDINKKRASRYIIMKKKGKCHNLPSGESSLGPLEGTTNGIFVVDASFIEKVDKPIRVTVNEGYATKIEGGKTARKLKKVLKSINDKNAYAIAELGIGTNDKAKITGNILEDEKVLGTAHIALGNNKSFHGKIDVPIHLDGIFKKPTIWVDNKKIMNNGKLLI